jgi:tetratricopeptide (TPR) repeat protein
VQAYTALASGDSAGAISLYTQAIESRDLAPELLANALLNRALAYQQQNQNGKAIDDYTAALSLDAMSAELRATALYNRGLSQQKTGKQTLAIEDFTNALMLNPTFSHAFLSRGNTLRDSGQYLFALSDFERALKYHHPEPARVYFSEAQTYELLLRPNDSKRMLEASLAANPNYAPAREKLMAMENGVPVAEKVAEAGNDTILTGSLSASGGNTLMHKPDLPKGVEPPAELVAAVAIEGDASVATAETPAFIKNKKEFVDRIAESDAAQAEDAQVDTSAIAETTSAESEKFIAVDSVPAIPPAVKKTAVTVKKPVEAPVEEVAANDEVADPVVVASTSAPVEGWTVQLASEVSEDAAWSRWKIMQKRFKALSGKSPVVMRADLGAKGVFYRLRLAGYNDKSGAQSACHKLKAKGLSCFISKATS